ncbi:hypothetical protein HYU17_03560 [Candidatus Woesearchaeota archaeon]|nr:hypothetical protein [Candidatus Woesearchaeota archaeon]
MVSATFGSIVKGALILVLALLIFGYLTSAGVKRSVNGYLSNIKSAVSSSLHRAADAPQNLKMSAQGTSCETLAKGFIPKYVFLKPCLFEGPMTLSESQTWLDWTAIGHEGDNLIGQCEIQFGAGSAQGENVNYLYTKQSLLVYSKNIISTEGVILGTRNFKVKLVLKKTPMTVAYGGIGFKGELYGPMYGYSDRVSGIGGYLNWTGFNKDIKDSLNVTEITFEVPNTCTQTSTNDSGEFYCLFNHYGDARIITTPDFINQNLYEVVSKDISNCHWVDNP